MFQRVDKSDRPTISLTFEGQEVRAHVGDSVAAALLAAGIRHFRKAPVSGAPRGPFCLMGSCFECWVEIDGIASRQACMETVRSGMVIKRQPVAGLTGLPAKPTARPKT